MDEIKLIGKRIKLDKCKEIFHCVPNEKDWKEYFEVKAGEWKYENGYLIGKEDGNKGGILYSKEYFNKNVMITFKVSTVSPATRDLNAVSCADWNNETNDLGDAYVYGVNGWYDNKAGVERNAYDGSLPFRCLTSAYHYEAGKEIELTCGAIDGHMFMLVDGELISEFIDTNNPLKGGHIGFSPYCTILKIRDISVREIYYEEIKQYYDPEF
ncbi:MAG: hypothetical protein MJ066_01755 [Clostridia bacterium]|nr:hypothetical protein [Clostridia bacterium]